MSAHRAEAPPPSPRPGLLLHWAGCPRSRTQSQSPPRRWASSRLWGLWRLAESASSKPTATPVENSGAAAGLQQPVVTHRVGPLEADARVRPRQNCRHGGVGQPVGRKLRPPGDSGLTDGLSRRQESERPCGDFKRPHRSSRAVAWEGPCWLPSPPASGHPTAGTLQRSHCVWRLHLESTESDYV